MFTRWGEELFESEQKMKDLILSYLRKGETSISGLSKLLRNDGYKLHRLALSGYLRALADVGILRPKDIPPSKVYTIVSGGEKSIYEAIGEKCRNLGLEDKEAATLGTFILQNLFHRPVFLHEVRKLNLGDIVLARRVRGDERVEARKVLSRRGQRIPDNDPAYLVERDKDYERMMNAILLEIIIEKFKAQALVMGPKQTRLHLDD